jgi:hypothetical protein
MSADKQQILETITSVARLITLIFKPKGTKISIRNHTIVLCEPGSDLYLGFKIPQGVDRFMNGDSREDIYNLNHVICNFIEWYIIPYKNSDPKIYRGLINMAKYLRVGLRELQSTYKTGTAVCTLQYYINVLTAVIDEKYNPEMMYHAHNSLTSSSSDTSHTASSSTRSFLDADADNSNGMIYSTILDINKFKSLWTKREISSLCDQFENCFRNPGESDNAVFKITESDMPDNTDNIDNGDHFDVTEHISEPDADDHDTFSTHESNKSVQEIQTQSQQLYAKKSIVMPVQESVHSSSSWPIPKSLGNVIVRGHLVGISDILDFMDRKFTKLLNQSVKGTN